MILSSSILRARTHPNVIGCTAVIVPAWLRDCLQQSMGVLLGKGQAMITRARCGGQGQRDGPGGHPEQHGAPGAHWQQRVASAGSHTSGLFGRVVLRFPTAVILMIAKGCGRC